nr:surface-adhesin E family protein [uncultured Acinetobacter sp.]
MLKQSILVVTLGLATFANASDWISLGNDGQREVYLDRQSIKYTNSLKSQRGVWTKDILLKNTELFKKSDKLVSYSTYDCTKSRIIINEVLHYNKAGKLVTDSKEGLKDGWQEIPPDSLFDVIQDIVCSAKI